MAGRNKFDEYLLAMSNCIVELQKASPANSPELPSGRDLRLVSVSPASSCASEAKLRRCSSSEPSNVSLEAFSPKVLVSSSPAVGGVAAKICVPRERAPSVTPMAPPDNDNKPPTPKKAPDSSSAPQSAFLRFGVVTADASTQTMPASQDEQPEETKSTHAEVANLSRHGRRTATAMSSKPAKKSTGYTSSFFVFMKDYRERLQKENPGARGAEITKMLGVAWRALAAEERRQYTERADSMWREKCQQQKIDDGRDPEGKEESTKASDGATRKATGYRNSFMIFAAKQRDELKQQFPSMMALDVAAVLGKRWRELTDDQRAHYKRKADAEWKAKLVAAGES